MALLISLSKLATKLSLPVSFCVDLSVPFLHQISSGTRGAVSWEKSLPKSVLIFPGG